MGSDMWFNPPREERRQLWEKVRELEGESLGREQKIRQLEKIIKDKNAEIAALKTALRSLGGKDPIFTRDA